MEEPEELRRFREEWKREVTQRTCPEDSVATSSSSVEQPLSSHAAGDVNDAPIIHEISPSTSSVLYLDRHTDFTSRFPTAARNRNQALEVYSQAVQTESQGQLDIALALYRRAFRLDGNVDKAYHRAGLERELSTDFGSLAIHTPRTDLASKGSHQEETNVTHLPSGVKSSKSARNALHRILTTFPPFDQLSFEPELENQPVLLNKLPDELLVYIIRHFLGTVDTGSIERFGLVSRKARILTLDQSIWRELVQSIYVSPQIPYSPLLLHNFDEDYRQYYICQPRVRLDGVYIAVCHYVRRGHSDNAWVAITHLITYHRYLRFLPNGVVLSFLSSDATASPASIIPHLLLDGPRLKGLHTGRWCVEPSLNNDGVYDIHEKRRAGSEFEEQRDHWEGPIVRIDGLLDTGGVNATPSEGGATPKYTFGMRLGLKSRPLGRWNKLDILDYYSVHIATDEERPLPLKHERPYWFSKVRSYGSGME